MRLTVIYTRVSTDKQSCESQLAELNSYCVRNQLSNIRQITDQISGSKFTRSGLDELMALVRTGKVETILCFRLDRLGRSLPHLAQLIGEFVTHQVAFVVPSQGIDTRNSNPASQLQINILIAFAQFERDLTRERVNAGLNAARARGAKLGAPEKLSQHSFRVQALLAQKLSVRQIATELNLPKSSVHKIKQALAA